MSNIVPFIYFLVVVYAGCPDQESFNFKFSTQSNPYGVGSNFNIPKGERWLFDLPNSPSYGTIEVFGTLVFSDQLDVQLNAQNIIVQSSGSFFIGSCDCPFKHKAIVELQSVPNQYGNLYGCGVKTIGAVDGAIISFFGELYGPSWTNLAQPVLAGATSIVLTENVNWKEGSVIALAPTGFPQYQNVNSPYSWADGSDNVTITAVNGNTVTFTPPLKYNHYSGIHHQVEERGEVALLTRNIVIRGNKESDIDGFGAHMIFLRGSFIQISGIEVTRSGQFKHLGRYPIHFHMMNDAFGSFVYDSAIHNNYQRSITVHGTHSVKIFRNVAYKTRGHMYFLEDGIETNNQFAWNLGMVVYAIAPSNFLENIKSDDQPSIFWITNPNNTFVHNVAAGSPLHCIWFALPINPTGPSFTRSVLPRWTPLQKFAYNTAHSCGSDGLFVDNGPNQLGVPGGPDDASIQYYSSKDSKGNTQSIYIGSGYDPHDNANDVVMANYDLYKNITLSRNAVFEAFTAYKCRNRAVWTRGSNLTFTHARFADNAIGITQAASSYCLFQDGIMVLETPNYGNNVTNYELQNGLYGLINNSPNAPFRETPKNWPPVSDIGPGQERGPFYPRRGYEFYDGPNEVKTTQFYGFKPDSRGRASSVSMLRQDQFGISQSNRATGIFSDSTDYMVLFPDMFHDGDKASIFLDLDGSVSGRTPTDTDNFPVIVNSHPFFRTSSCSYSTGQEISVCPNHFVGVGFSFNSNVQYPSDLTSLPGLIKIQRPDKIGSPLYLCGGKCNGGYEVNETLSQADSFFGTLMLFRDYYFQFMTVTVPSDFSFRIGNQRTSVNGGNTAPHNELIMAFCYPPNTVVQTIQWNWMNNVSQAKSLDAMRNEVYNDTWPNSGRGMWFHDKSTNWLYVRMIIGKSQVTYPMGFGTGSWIRIVASVSQNTAPCTVPSVADNSISDKYRTVPPISSYRTSPAPWTAPEPTKLDRDSSQLQITCNVKPTPAPTKAPTKFECSNFNTCATCLTGGCQFCPQSSSCQNQGETCTDPSLRTKYCEDSVEQVLKNAPSNTPDIIKDGNTRFINDTTTSSLKCSINSLDVFNKTSTGEANTKVHFTCESVPTAKQTDSICDSFVSVFATRLKITQTRIGCKVLSWNKRAVSGTANMVITEPTATFQPSPSSEEGLSGGAIAGIIIGILIVVILVVIVAGFFMWKKMNSHESV